MARTGFASASGGRARGGNGSGSHTLYNDLLSVAGGLMRNRKDSSAEALGSMAEATRDYASRLEMPAVSTYVSSAADQLDYLADYMMENNVEDMIEDAGSFARRHPVAAFGLAAAAGFGLTRMMGLNAGASSRRQGSSGNRQSARRGRNRRGDSSASANG